MNRPYALLALPAVLLLLAVGCANPADDAPAAEVTEPAAAPEPAASTAAEVVYEIDPATSKIEFVGSKVTGSHDGGFQVFSGTFTVPSGTIEGSSVDVTIDTTSLWTDTDKVTEHLKSADFFDVATYPTATFTSSSIATSADGGYTVTGNLDLHGVTKQISFPAEIDLTVDGFDAEAEFSIKRFDFGIEYKGRADDLIRDEVLIKLDLQSAAPIDQTS